LPDDPGAAMIFSNWIETVGSALDLVGVALIAIGLVIAFMRYAGVVFAPPPELDPYRRLRQDIGRAILLGLEVLVAADIIRTVAVTPTLTSVAVLGAIVAIRTFLSISLQMEVEGRFPWQRADAKQEG
jgi:uncharacterized membrane protein